MKQRGVTLVELLTTISATSILLGMAVPGYGFLIDSLRLSGLTNDMVTSLNLARSEAIKRGVRVTVCKSGNAMDSNPTCSAKGGWQQGWIVFVDRGVPGERDGVDPLLYTREAIPRAVISGASTFDKFISYMPSGVSRGGTGFSANGTLCVNLNGGNRKIVLNNTGRIRVDRKNAC